MRSIGQQLYKLKAGKRRVWNGYWQEKVILGHTAHLPHISFKDGFGEDLDGLQQGH